MTLLNPILRLSLCAVLTGCLDTEPIDLGDARASEHDTDAAAEDASDEADSAGPDAAGDTTPDAAATCVVFAPTALDFALVAADSSSTLTANLLNCGTGAVAITGIEFGPETGGWLAVASTSFPRVLEPGQGLALPVTVTNPSLAGTHTAELFAMSGGSEVARLPIRAQFGDPQCPIAAITVPEGDEVLPQTMLHLSGATSTAFGGATIASYEWSVVQPSGSVSSFIPSPYVADPSFEANIVGDYIFRLRVTDSFGTLSCSVAEYTVTVTSGDAIHVELLWKSPGAPDGAIESPDLDLHFLHPNAAGYFDATYDVYWDNPEPEWGIYSPSDNPHLDLDDTDGGGPEDLRLAIPEQDVRYCIGVHYWDDFGFGSSFATLRIYIYSVLRLESADVELVAHDMWDAACISWPSGTVESLGSDDGTYPRITHGITQD